MKLYVINLDRAADRMARIGGLLNGMGVPFVRVPAVDGNMLPPPPAEAPSDAWLLSRGEIACIRSHQKCWDLFEASGEPYCTIIEDDVHFGAGFAAFMRAAHAFPAGFDLIKIEATRFKIWLDKRDTLPAFGGRALARLASPHMGTAGYIVSRSALPKLRLLTAQYKHHPMDVIMFGAPGKGLISYQLLPSIVIQDNALNKLQGVKPQLALSVNRGRKPKPTGLKKVLREIGRPLRPYWPPGPLSQKWRLSYGMVAFE
jgi:glycosyl transferase family 25